LISSTMQLVASIVPFFDCPIIIDMSETRYSLIGRWLPDLVVGLLEVSQACAKIVEWRGVASTVPSSLSSVTSIVSSYNH
jgi:hypothetical protein